MKSQLQAVDQDKLFQELGLTSSHQTMAQKQKLAKQQQQQAINAWSSTQQQQQQQQHQQQQQQQILQQQQQQNQSIKQQNDQIYEMEDIINMNHLLSQQSSQHSTHRQKNQLDSIMANSFGLQQQNNLLTDSQRFTQRSGNFNNNFGNPQNQISPEQSQQNMNNTEQNETFSNTENKHQEINDQAQYVMDSNIKEEENEGDDEDEINRDHLAEQNKDSLKNSSQQDRYYNYYQQDEEEEEDINIVLVLELPNGQNHEVNYKLSDDVEEVALNIATKFNIKKQGCDHIIQLLKETQQQFIDERNAKLEQEQIAQNNLKDLSTKNNQNISSKFFKNGFGVANASDNFKQSTKPFNAGVKLYEKGLKDKSKQQEKLEKLKSQQENMLKTELTFKPIINKNSKEIIKQKDNEDKSKRESFDPKKYDKNRSINLKVEYFKQQKQLMEMQECTFKPKVNEISSKIIEQKSMKQEKKGDKFTELYNGARQSQLKKDELAYAVQQEKLKQQQQEKVYFNQLNRQHQKYQTYNHNSLLNNDLSFLERMQVDIQNKREKMKTETDFYENFTEEGQPLFKPQIGRPPKLERNKENVPIYEYLYSQRSKSSQNLRQTNQQNSSTISKGQQKSQINSYQLQQSQFNQNFQYNQQQQVKPEQMDYLNRYVESDLEMTNKMNNESQLSSENQQQMNSFNINNFNGRKRTISNLDDKSKKSSQINSSASNQRDTSPCFYANQRSQELFNLNKEKKLRQIFEIMDSDSDGLISADKIEIRPLSTQVLEAFKPMLLQMEQLCIQLNLEQFLQASQKVVDNMTVDEKNNLFYNFKHKWENKKKQMNECPFKPQINQKSLQIAQRQPSSGQSLYEQQLIREQKKEERIRQEQQKLLQKELEECSFQPHLYKSHLGKKVNSQQQS